ncbi:dihydrofolate reductase family protein [Actinopolymorpha alba]|uniref:dihydrofolate reductase family protein n=1 Tax=Actinopolymorpha alba TaxID=533267 RepID=UPI0003737975|nr:dihydrofolate reductase family protein [Actinopolymorpha alba]
MGNLIYAAIMSLDGYIEDEDGKFDWAVPDEEVHAFVNDLERGAGTYLYGRRMYETMNGWETDPGIAAQSALAADFAQIWQAADKIVYSTTLQEVSTTRTCIERAFDPEAVRELEAKTSHDIAVGGPSLAAHAIKAGLVDEYHLFLIPIMVGGGKPALPAGVWTQLELLDEPRFGNGVAYLRYLAKR